MRFFSVFWRKKWWSWYPLSRELFLGWFCLLLLGRLLSASGNSKLGLLEASAWKACGGSGGSKTSGRRRTVSPEKWRRCVFFSYFEEKNGGLGTLREENFSLDGFASSCSSLVCERQQYLGLLEASAWKACGGSGGLKTSGRRRTVSPEKWRRCVFFSYFGEKNGGLGTLREENFSLDGFASSRSSLVCERQQYLGLLEASAWKACGGSGGLKASGRLTTVSPETWRRCAFFSYFGEKNGGLGTLREENFSLDGFASSRSSLVCEQQQYLGLLEASAWKACGGSGGLKASGRLTTVSPETWRRCAFSRVLEKKQWSSHPP